MPKWSGAESTRRERSRDAYAALSAPVRAPHALRAVECRISFPSSARSSLSRTSSTSSRVSARIAFSPITGEIHFAQTLAVIRRAPRRIPS